MATWPEARAAKDERQRREHRYFTPDRRGPRCPVCSGPTCKRLVDQLGSAVHPTCAEPVVMRAQRARDVADAEARRAVREAAGG